METNWPAQLITGYPDLLQGYFDLCWNTRWTPTFWAPKILHQPPYFIDSHIPSRFLSGLRLHATVFWNVLQEWPFHFSFFPLLKWVSWAGRAWEILQVFSNAQLFQQILQMWPGKALSTVQPVFPLPVSRPHPSHLLAKVVDVPTRIISANLCAEAPMHPLALSQVWRPGMGNT